MWQTVYKLFSNIDTRTFKGIRDVTFDSHERKRQINL